MIRPATARDAEAIAAVRVAAIRELASVAYSQEQIESWLSSGAASPLSASGVGDVTLVEEVEGCVVAFAQLDLRIGAVERVYVSPSFARRGIAARLLARLEAIAQEQGLSRLSIDATLNAVPFYESVGYSAVRLCEHELQGGVVFPCAAMVKDLRRESV